VASLSQGRTAAAQCGLFTHKSVPVIFEPPCKTIKIEQTQDATILYLLFIEFNYRTYIEMKHWNIKN